MKHPNNGNTKKRAKHIIIAMVIVILVLLGVGGTYLFFTWNAENGSTNSNVENDSVDSTNANTNNASDAIIYLNENGTNGNIPTMANQNVGPDNEKRNYQSDNADSIQENSTRSTEENVQQETTTTTTTEISGISKQDTTSIANVTKDFASAINGNMPDSVDYSQAKSFSDAILPKKNNLFRYSSTNDMTDSGTIMAQMDAAKQGEESGNVTINLVSDNGRYKIMNVIAKGDVATVTLKVATDSNTGKLLYLFPYAFVGNDGKLMTD